MTKWEYMYVEAYKRNITLINDKEVGELKSIFQGFTGQPSISKFLEKVGQEGWELVGMCGDGEYHCRLVLKRSVP